MSQHEKKLGSIKYGDADTVGNSQNTRSSIRQVKNSKNGEISERGEC